MKTKLLRNVCSLTLSLALIGSPAFAQTAGSTQPSAQPSYAGRLSDSLRGEARDAFGRATSLFEAGNYAAARVEFEQAHALSGDARLLYNVAVCDKELGRYARAIRELQTSLDLGGSKLPKSYQRRVVETIRTLEPFVTTLTVETTHAGATVLVRCGPNETCAGGTCQPAKVNEIELPDFREEMVFGAAAGDACFSEEACLSDSTFVELDPSTSTDVCEFDLPPDAVVDEDGRARANVSIQWAVAPERVIVLDEGDPIEGWTFVGPSRARLSEGVCLSLRDAVDEDGNRLVPDEALGVFVSTSCAPKKKLQAFCTASDGHVSIGAKLNP